MKPVYQQVYDILVTIPRGKVTTYGSIAKKLNINPRYVGRILHVNPHAPEVPCHRVVKSDGTFAGGYAMGGTPEQMKRLADEGVHLAGERVVRSDIIQVHN